MFDDEQKIVEICNAVYGIMQIVTHDLPIPSSEKTRNIRKKISVFTYGIIIELTKELGVNEDSVYAKYLLMGGLNSEQADKIVARTRDEFCVYEFGDDCLKAANNVVNQWKAGDKDLQKYLIRLL